MLLKLKICVFQKNYVFCSKIQFKTQFFISYMVIDSVEIGGFANIRDVKVVLNDVIGERDAYQLHYAKAGLED